MQDGSRFFWLFWNERCFGIVLECKMDQEFFGCFGMKDGSRLWGLFCNAIWIKVFGMQDESRFGGCFAMQDGVVLKCKMDQDLWGLFSNARWINILGVVLECKTVLDFWECFGMQELKMDLELRVVFECKVDQDFGELF